MRPEVLLASGAAAVAAALMGCFAVMRRMALAADALSHIALPGISIALALHVHPLFGAVTMLLFGGLLVWALEDRSRLTTETIIGVVFSAALAIGSMLASGEDLIDALFGRAGTPSWTEVVSVLAVSAAVVVFVLRRKNDLVITLVSPDIARTAGIDIRRLDLLYLEMFALTVAIGLRYLGVLLMGSLVIIPAATARRLSHNLTQMLLIAAVVALVVTVLGTSLAVWLHRETGSLIVALAAGVFFLSLLRRPS